MKPRSMQSRRAPPSAAGDPPLTSERVMMEQIRAKLERAQLRLARSGAGAVPGSAAGGGSRYIPSSEYASHAHKPPVRSVRLEDMPAAAAAGYPPSANYGLAPPSTRRTHAPPPTASSRSRYYSAAKQYQSRSKYAGLKQEDPLNGGPPPMSTPYLVYSSSKPITYSAASSRRPGSSGQFAKPQLDKYASSIRAPPPSALKDPARDRGAPPSSMMGFHHTAAPPSSRVRFEADYRAKQKEAHYNLEQAPGTKLRDARELAQQERRRHMLRRQDARDTQSNIKDEKMPTKAASSKVTEVEVERPRRNSLVMNPPKSAIKISAFTEGIPGSPVARPRRGSAAAAPPKSDIKVSAFDDILPSRRSSAPEPPVSVERHEPVNLFQDSLPINELDKASVVAADTPIVVVQSEECKEIDKSVERPVDSNSDAESETQTEGSEDHFALVTDNQALSPQADVSALAATLSVDDDDEDDDDEGDTTSGSEVPDFSDFDVDSQRTDNQFSDNGVFSEESSDEDDNGAAEFETIAEVDEDMLSSNNQYEADEQVSTSEENQQATSAPSSKLTPHQIALQALGRDITKTDSTGSRGSARLSFVGRTHTAPPRSSQVLGNGAATSNPTPARAVQPIPAPPATMAAPRVPTVSRPKPSSVVPPAPQTAGYVRRARARLPLDLKRQLPPSIGALSGLQDGPTKFTLDESAFYEVEWKTGEFGFSMQRVYYCERNYREGTETEQLCLRMLLNTDRSICKSFRHVRVGDILIRIGKNKVADLGLEGSPTVLTKFFERLQTQTPIRLTFQRMHPSEWEGGVEL